jgi:hypothetical protein
MPDVNGKLPTFSMVKSGIPVRTQVYLRRVPMEEVPAEDPKKCADFLNNLYLGKVT